MQIKVRLFFFSYSRSLSLENFLHVLYLCCMTNYRSVHISVRSTDKLFDFSYKSVLDSMHLHFYFYFTHCYWRIYWREEKGGQQWVREDCDCLTVRKVGSLLLWLNHLLSFVQHGFFYRSRVYQAIFQRNTWMYQIWR